MTLLRIAASLLLGAVMVACAIIAPQPAADYSTLVITLERTVCFGFCPAYTITIYGDGRVVYEGEQFVDVTGQQTATLTPEQFKELVAAFEQADYFSLKDSYTALVTDLPSTITSVTLDGRTKTIVNYGGCFFDDLAGDEKAPQALCDFESKIDAVTNSAQWVGN